MEHRFELRRGMDLLSKCFHFTSASQFPALMLQLSRCFLFRLPHCHTLVQCPASSHWRLWIPSLSNMFFGKFSSILPMFCLDFQRYVLIAGGASKQSRRWLQCRFSAPDHECGGCRRWAWRGGQQLQSGHSGCSVTVIHRHL